MSGLPLPVRLRRLPVLLAVGAVLGVRVPLARAQEGEALVAQRELEFEAARRAYGAAEAAWQAALSRAERASLAITEARASGDRGALNRAFARAQAQWYEVETLERRVRATRDTLEAARASLAEALELRLEELAVEARSARGPEARAELRALIRDRTIRLREVEAALDEEAPGRFAAVVPEIPFDPRDGPLELQAKAELLARRAERADSALAAVDREIAQLERRARRNRALENFMRGIERFDEGAVPIGPRRGTGRGEGRAGSGERAEGAPAGGEEEAAGALTVEERMERLAELRRQLEAYRDAVARRAELFRRRAREVTP